MKNRIKLIAVSIVLMLTLASCVSVNRLDEYSFQDKTMVPFITAPAFAEVRLSRGSIDGADESVLLSIIEIGANVAVGIEEQKLEQRLNEILRGSELKIALETEFVPATASMLGTMTVSDPGNADYLLDVEVTEYGLTSGGGVYMNITVDARIVHSFSGETVWRRRLSVSEPASPGIFGVNDYVGTAINVAILDQLSDEQLQDGFRRLSEQAAFTLSEKFRRDYFEARRN